MTADGARAKEPHPKRPRTKKPRPKRLRTKKPRAARARPFDASGRRRILGRLRFLADRRRNPEGRMSLASHLGELRSRFIRSLAGVCVGAVVGWFLYEPVLDFILEPLTALEDSRTQINFQTIGAGFDLKMRMSLWIGAIVSSPWWIYQVGAYIGPGLKRSEKAYGAAFGCVGVALFAAGAFSAVRMAPHAVRILQSFVPDGSYSLLEAGSYVTFYTRLVLAFGISFLVPEVLTALNFLGLLSARRMLGAWRWAVVLAFVFAAIANPLPSPWPMTVQAFVLIGLYLAAVLIAWANERIRARRRSGERTGLIGEPARE